MIATTQPPRRQEIETRQLALLQGLLRRIAQSNQFYQRKLNDVSLDPSPSNLADFQARFPFTLKTELVADQAAHPLFGSDLSSPIEQYTRFHQTSGTTGHPLRWLDTPKSWAALVENWVQIYAAADVSAGDRIYFAFSFGPFIGFWLAFDAGQLIGALCVPGGGLSTAGRLQAILENQITVVCCTPTYALRLAEVARKESISLAASKVRRLIVAGEPGGSIPSVRARIEAAWPGARVFDHHGMTEVGPVTYECPATPGLLHVIESAYLPEVIDPKTLRAVEPSHPGELVLTTLTREDSPLVRYRTGDLVKMRIDSAPCACGRSEAAFEGGILGRTDDMLIVRGINIFPGAIDAVLSEFPEVAEFQITVSRGGSLTEIEVLMEPAPDFAKTGDEVSRRVEARLHAAFNLRIPVRLAPPGSLPRYEMKARRWVFS